MWWNSIWIAYAFILYCIVVFPFYEREYFNSIERKEQARLEADRVLNNRIDTRIAFIKHLEENRSA